MGGIIFWGIVRTAILIPILWVLYGITEYRYWWWLGIFSVYGVIIHPAMIQYRMFLKDNDEVINDTLCSTCKNFDKTAVICLKYDKHPTIQELPCQGLDWEPTELKNEKTEVHS